MESRDLTPSAAREALRDVAAAQSDVARRAGAPLWYRLGAALCTSALFLGIGLVVGRPVGDGEESASMVLVVVGAIIAPVLLVAALKRTTGVSTDRYARGMGWWTAQMFVLLGVGFALQAFLDVPYALLLAGVGAFLLTYDRERRIDRALRERVRAAG